MRLCFQQSCKPRRDAMQLSTPPPSVEPASQPPPPPPSVMLPNSVSQEISGLADSVLDWLPMCAESRHKLDDLLAQFARLHLDHKEFACLKLLAVFNPAKHGMFYICPWLVGGGVSFMNSLLPLVGLCLLHVLTVVWRGHNPLIAPETHPIRSTLFGCSFPPSVSLL